MHSIIGLGLSLLFGWNSGESHYSAVVDFAKSPFKLWLLDPSGMAFSQIHLDAQTQHVDSAHLGCCENAMSWKFDIGLPRKGVDSSRLFPVLNWLVIFSVG